MKGKIAAKRFLAFFIALLMVTSFIPQTSYAEPGEGAGSGNEQSSENDTVLRGGVGGTPIEIVGLNSVIVSGAEQQSNGDYVWTPTNTNPDHPFKFNVTYSVSGEFEYFEANQIEIRIPLTILKDQNGNPADYYEMSLPL